MIKIGMVGVGAISGIYLENITKIFNEIELVAVCDLVKERAETAKLKYNIPKIYDTMDELFADPEIDLVLNITRPYEHFAVSKAALLAGKHVYSEKPLGASFAEGLELVHIAKEKGLMLGGAPDTFMGAGIQTCRRIIDEGTIGDIVAASGAMICRGHETWHPDPEFYYKYGGGPMLDMGPYYVTAMINLLGGVKSVIGSVKTSFKQRCITSKPHLGEIIDVEVPTYITGALTFDSGVIATLTTTFDVYKSNQSNIEVYGSKGTLFVPDPNTFGGPVKVYDGVSGTITEYPLSFDYDTNSRALGLADIAKAIQTGRRSRVSYIQTLHVLEIMEAFVSSSDSQKAIQITSHFNREAPMQNGIQHGTLD